MQSLTGASLISQFSTSVLAGCDSTCACRFDLLTIRNLAPLHRICHRCPKCHTILMAKCALLRAPHPASGERRLKRWRRSGRGYLSHISTFMAWRKRIDYAAGTTWRKYSMWPLRRRARPFSSPQSPRWGDWISSSRGTYNITRAAIPRLGPGSAIVNVSSVMGLTAAANYAI